MKDSAHTQTFTHKYRWRSIFFLGFLTFLILSNLAEMLVNDGAITLNSSPVIFIAFVLLPGAGLIYSAFKEYVQITLTDDKIIWQTLLGWRKELAYRDVVGVRRTAVNNLELIGHKDNILISTKLKNYHVLRSRLAQKIPALAKHDSKSLFTLQSNMPALYLKLGGMFLFLLILGLLFFPFGLIMVVLFFLDKVNPYLKRPVGYTFTATEIQAQWLQKSSQTWPVKDIQRIRMGRRPQNSSKKDKGDPRRIEIELFKQDPILLDIKTLEQYNTPIEFALKKLQQLYPHTQPGHVHTHQRNRQRQEAQQMLKEASRLQQNGDLKQALETYKRAISLDGTLSLYWFVVGDLLFDLARYQEAAVAYRRGLHGRSNHQEHWDRLGYCLLHSGQDQPAQQALDQAIKINPANALAYYGAAIAYARLGQEQKAQGYLKEAQHLEPKLHQKVARHPLLASISKQASRS